MFQYLYQQTVKYSSERHKKTTRVGDTEGGVKPVFAQKYIFGEHIDDCIYLFSAHIFFYSLFMCITDEKSYICIKSDKSFIYFAVFDLFGHNYSLQNYAFFTEDSYLLPKYYDKYMGISAKPYILTILLFIITEKFL